MRIRNKSGLNLVHSHKEAEKAALQIPFTISKIFSMLEIYIGIEFDFESP